MAVLATDNFNRANGPLGANWATQTGQSAPTILTNQVATSDVMSNGARYSAVTWPDNQYSKIAFPAATLTPGSHQEARTRCATAAWTYYAGGYENDFFGNNQRRIWKVVAETFTSLAVEAIDIVAGDTARLDAEGTTVRLLVNGVQRLSVVDSAIAAGQAGFGQRDGNTNTSINDDWEGGDFAAAGGYVQTTAMALCGVGH